MEVKGGHNNKLMVCFYEGFGAGILILMINWSSDYPDIQPFAIGITLFVNIILFGNVCGAHFNPAVTMGVLVREGMENLGANIVFFIMHVVAQVLGMILFVIVAWLGMYYGDCRDDKIK